MRQKILITAKVDSHIIHFHKPIIEMFSNKGYEVHVASEGDSIIEKCDKKFNIKFGTNPFSKQVIKSYKELKKLLIENQYEIIHTHTAIASVLTRLVAYNVNRKRQIKIRVIYTAHGFHFLKGGKKRDWLLFFPIEYLFSKVTDDLILINNDDYLLAEKFRMGKKRYYVPGVGIDLNKFSNKSEHLSSQPFKITYIAEFSENKNHLLLVQAVQLLLLDRKDIVLQLVGSGDKFDSINEYVINNNLDKQVKLLGYRTDIPEILRGTDLVVSPSLREGLPINIVESMASGIPLIVSKCRGHLDLVENNINGFLVDFEKNEIAEKINFLLDHTEVYSQFSKENVIRSKQYNVESIMKIMEKIYFD